MTDWLGLTASHLVPAVLWLASYQDNIHTTGVLAAANIPEPSNTLALEPQVMSGQVGCLQIWCSS